MESSRSAVLRAQGRAHPRPERDPLPTERPRKLQRRSTEAPTILNADCARHVLGLMPIESIRDLERLLECPPSDDGDCLHTGLLLDRLPARGAPYREALEMLHRLNDERLTQTSLIDAGAFHHRLCLQAEETISDLATTLVSKLPAWVAAGMSAPHAAAIGLLALQHGLPSTLQVTLLGVVIGLSGATADLDAAKSAVLATCVHVAAAGIGRANSVEQIDAWLDASASLTDHPAYHLVLKQTEVTSFHTPSFKNMGVYVKAIGLALRMSRDDPERAATIAKLLCWLADYPDTTDAVDNDRARSRAVHLEAVARVYVAVLDSAQGCRDRRESGWQAEVRTLMSGLAPLCRQLPLRMIGRDAADALTGIDWNAAIREGHDADRTREAKWIVLIDRVASLLDGSVAHLADFINESDGRSAPDAACLCPQAFARLKTMFAKEPRLWSKVLCAMAGNFFRITYRVQHAEQLPRLRDEASEHQHAGNPEAFEALLLLALSSDQAAVAPHRYAELLASCSADEIEADRLRQIALQSITDSPANPYGLVAIVVDALEQAVSRRTVIPALPPALMLARYSTEFHPSMTQALRNIVAVASQDPSAEAWQLLLPACGRAAMRNSDFEVMDRMLRQLDDWPAALAHDLRSMLWNGLSRRIADTHLQPAVAVLLRLLDGLPRDLARLDPAAARAVSIERARSLSAVVIGWARANALEPPREASLKTAIDTLPRLASAPAGHYERLMREPTLSAAELAILGGMKSEEEAHVAALAAASVPYRPEIPGDIKAVLQALLVPHMTKSPPTAEVARAISDLCIGDLEGGVAPEMLEQVAAWLTSAAGPARDHAADIAEELLTGMPGSAPVVRAFQLTIAEHFKASAPEVFYGYAASVLRKVNALPRGGTAAVPGDAGDTDLQTDWRAFGASIFYQAMARLEDATGTVTTDARLRLLVVLLKYANRHGGPNDLFRLVHLLGGSSASMKAWIASQAEAAGTLPDWVCQALDPAARPPVRIDNSDEVALEARGTA